MADPSLAPQHVDLVRPEVDQATAPPEHGWLEFVRALIGQLRAHPDDGRIDPTLRQGAPLPLQAVDKHNAALDAALHASD